MGMQEFGQYIRSLRLERHFINAEGERQQWTQEELSRRTKIYGKGLSRRQIGSIERGETIGVLDDIPYFIQAFELGSEAANHLYRLGDYAPPREKADPEVDLEMIKRVFTKLPYPASARTFLWDFIAFNSYHYEVFGYTPDKIAMLNEKDNLGPNLLRVLFDPKFGHDFKVGSRPGQLREDLARNLRIYRAKTSIYTGNRRLKKILTEMETYPFFPELWSEAQHAITDDSELQLPFTRIQVTKNDFIEFVSLRVHQYLGEDVDVSVYVPVVTSEEKYRKLQTNVKNKVKNKEIEAVYFFGGEPIRKE